MLLKGLGLEGDAHMGEKVKHRSPVQLDDLQKGLIKGGLDQDEQGKLIGKAGIMGIVLEGETINVGDEIVVKSPEKPYIKLERV